ncbi:hypothetical protein GP486_008254 [Trichoglossum hirsutum]|uniref:Uncharacterized protein n=1 Tax=Trichoglossum hirsutum TaxID=265104 RepID=A0A9P8IGC9_9PEZI|nr:hypothetical protein GP486_008254 [Trichoglossum hirsutum]
MAAPQPRTNQYFIPGDGISREVITADICRYLGNDALVRPGQYQVRRVSARDGFYITAYRNLTSVVQPAPTNLMEDAVLILTVWF